MFNDLFPHTAKKEPDIITKWLDDIAKEKEFYRLQGYITKLSTQMNDVFSTNPWPLKAFANIILISNQPRATKIEALWQAFKIIDSHWAAKIVKDFYSEIEMNMFLNQKERSIFVWIKTWLMNPAV
jgi:hypothetical protein